MLFFQQHFGSFADRHFGIFPNVHITAIVTTLCRPSDYAHQSKRRTLTTPDRCTGIIPHICHSVVVGIKRAGVVGTYHGPQLDIISGKRFERGALSSVEHDVCNEFVSESLSAHNHSTNGCMNVCMQVCIVYACMYVCMHVH